MKKYKSILILLSLLVITSPFLSAQKVFADTDNSQVGFSVSPNYNDAQKKDSSFFDLLVKPNSQQTIGVTVTNTSQSDSEYTIQIVQASTNKNGVIDYTDTKTKPLNTAPFQLDKQSAYDKNIKLSAGESKQVPLVLNIPDKPFKGEVLGGVNVTKSIPKNKKRPQLVNEYSYVIGLRLRESSDDIERNLTSEQAKPVVTFGKTGVMVPIKNDQATSMGKLTVESILKRDGKEIKKDTYKNREIAPNSIYPYSLSWDRKDYVPGKYQLSIIITDAQSHKWSFNKEFRLKAKEVKEVKDAAVHPTQEDHRWIWILIGVFVIIILALLFILFRSKYKNLDLDKEGRF